MADPVDVAVDDPVEAKALPAPRQTREVETSYGVARVLTWPAARPRGDLLLMHGAGGKLDAADLVRVVADAPRQGVTAHLLQQPFAVAGKRIGPRPAVLDAALDEVVGTLSFGPLVLCGRSAGARCAVRRAGALGTVGALALSFPLHPPGRPERSRAEELVGCAAPTLVVQGERDPFGGPSEVAAVPGEREVVAVPGADHGFAVVKRYDGPDPLALLSDAVSGWLGRLLPVGE